MPGDERGRQRLAVDVDPIEHDTDRLDGGQPAADEVEQELVLPFGVVLLDLLDGVDHAVDAHEPHDVTGDAARQRDHQVLGPLLEMTVPRKEGEFRLVEAACQSHERSLSCLVESGD